MMQNNKEKAIKYGLFIIVSLFIFGLTSKYLMYRTGLYGVWNGLAYFEIGIIASGGVFLFLLAGYLLMKPVPKYEVVFFGLVLAFGLLYMLVITPLSGPDEHYHYDEAYRISNMLILSKNPDLVYEDYSQLISHQNVESGYIRILEEFGAKKPETMTLGSDGRKAEYFVSYLPQAIGILIGRLLNRNFITLFLLGRFVNLLFYAGCVYIAIKNIPRFKVLTGLISMMPMALHQAASFSTDAFINGLCFVLISYAFKMIWADEHIERTDIVISFVVAALLAPAKVIYCVIVVLFFLISPDKIGTEKQKVKMICTMIAVSGASIILFQLPFLLEMTEPSGSTLNWEGQQNYDVAFVLAHPIKTAKIFWDTFVYYKKIWLEQAIGMSLSGLSLYVSKDVIYSYLITMCIAIFASQGAEFKVGIGIRAVCLVSAIGIVILAMASMFLLWTSNTRSMIAGVQGRYLIPAIPLVAISLSANRIRIYDRLMNFNIIFATALNYLVIAEVLRCTLLSLVAY